MLARKFGNYLLATNTHASAAALIFAVLPFFGIPTGFLAAIILGLVTLIKGPRVGLIILAWAALPLLCQLYLRQWAVLDVISLARLVAVWGFAWLFRTKISWRLVLEMQALLGLLIVIAFHAWIGDVGQWWLKSLNTYLQWIGLGESFNLTPTQLQAFIHQIAPLATGVVVTGALAGILVLLLLARYWQQSLVFSSGSFGSEFRYIRMSLLDTGVLLIAAIACLKPMPVILDLLPVLIFPFTVTGLSLLHYGADRKKPNKLLGKTTLNRVMVFLLVAAYLGLVFIPWAVALVLAFLGVIDSGYNIRKKVFDIKRAKV